MYSFIIIQNQSKVWIRKKELIHKNEHEKEKSIQYATEI